MKRDLNTIRFSEKVRAAVALGMLPEWLGDELKEFYEARNAIHLHAEIRKDVKWEVDFAKRVYRRLKPFCEEINAFVLSDDGKKLLQHRGVPR